MRSVLRAIVGKRGASRLSAAILAAAIVLLGQGTAQAVVKTWTGTSNANWNTPARWSPAGTPIAGDDAVLPTTATVTVSGAISGLASITISAGTLTANAAVGTTTLTATGGTVNGSSTLTATTLTAPSGTFTMGAAVTATNITVSGGALTVSTAHAGITSISVSAGTLTANAAVGTTTLTATGGTVNGSSTLTATTLAVPSGAFTMGAAVAATNITASGGTLTVSTAHTVGSVTVAGGTLTPSAALTITGNLSVTSGSFTMDGNVVTSATTNLTAVGGTLTVGTPHTVGDVMVSGGTLTPTTALTVSGDVSVTSGSFTMDANVVTSAATNVTASGGTLTVSAAQTVGDITVSGGTLTANAAVTVSGTFSVSSGSFTGSGTVTAPTVLFSGATTFTGNVNATSLTVSAGALTAGNNVTATNITASGGTLTVSTAHTVGNLTLSGGGLALTAALTVTGSLSVTSGTYTLDANVITSGTTSITASGGTLTVGTAHTVGNLTMSGGTVTTTAALTVTTGLSVTSGTFTMGTNLVTSGTTSITASGGTLTVGTAHTVGSLTVSGGTVTTTAALTVTTSLSVTSGAFTMGTNVVTSGTTSLAVSGGTLTVSTAHTVGNLTVSGGTLTVNANLTVTGTFSFTGGTIDGTATISAGTLAYSGGTVSGSATVTGSGVTLNSTTLTIPSGTTYTVSSAATLGSVTVSGGTFVTNASTTLTGTLTLTSGTVTLNANLSAASIAMSGGTMTVSGSTATVATTGNFTLSGGTFTSGSTSANTISVGGNLSIADPGLLGHWKLDETTIGTAADSSGNGYNGTHVWTSGTGPTWSASVPTVGFQDPRSLKFVTGNRDAVRLPMPAGLQVPLPLTISAWYRATTMGTNAGEIASGTDSYVLRLSRATGTIDVVKRTSAGLWTTLSTTAANYLDGNWHQVVGVFNTTGMTVYYDGVAVGSNTDTTAVYYDSTVNYFAIGRNGGTNALCDFDGNIDDVRVYGRALGAAEITALSTGSQPATMVLSSPLSVTGSLSVDAGGTLTLSGANSVVTMGNNQTLTINGTLNASTSAATGPTIKTSGSPNTFHFYVGSANGEAPTLNISSLAVKNTDSVGMRINGNATVNTTATTTFSQFDNVKFSEGTSAGTAYLQIYATSLYLVSHGCEFGAGESTLPAAAVKLTGNGFTNGATETRAIFGGTKCADTWAGTGTDKTCPATAKSDNDASPYDGIGDTAGTNGAVIQFVRAAKSDTDGTIEGFPTAAFSWDTFIYYSTYVAYHDADSTGTKDRVYVRKTDGTTASSTYYWEAPAGETIVGTPRWNTVGTKHFVYVALASGKVYQLVDDTGAYTLTTVGATWTTNPFLCTTSVTPNATTAVITTPISMDLDNLYFGGTATAAATSNYVWSVKQTDGTQVITPYAVSGAVTTAAPAVWTNGGHTFVTMGLAGQITSVDITSSTATLSNTAPVGSVGGRIVFGEILYWPPDLTRATATLFVSDNVGNIMGISPTNASNAARWTFNVGSTTIGPSLYDYTNDTLIFGTAAGKLYSFSAATKATVAYMTGYSSGYAPNSNADPFSNAPLFVDGILVVGTTGGATTGGKLFVIDRNTSTASTCPTAGAAPSLIRQYNFGPSVTVSGVGYDASSSRYMVTTASSTTAASISEGTLYYIDKVTDPTSCK